jgi:hypothetical protein
MAACDIYLFCEHKNLKRRRFDYVEIIEHISMERLLAIPDIEYERNSVTLIQ